MKHTFYVVVNDAGEYLGEYYYIGERMIGWVSTEYAPVLFTEDDANRFGVYHGGKVKKVTVIVEEE